MKFNIDRCGIFVLPHRPTINCYFRFVSMWTLRHKHKSSHLKYTWKMADSLQITTPSHFVVVIHVFTKSRCSVSNLSQLLIYYGREAHARVDERLCRCLLQTHARWFEPRLGESATSLGLHREIAVHVQDSFDFGVDGRLLDDVARSARSCLWSHKRELSMKLRNTAFTVCLIAWRLLSVRFKQSHLFSGWFNS